jgi:hypothetical protein
MNIKAFRRSTEPASSKKAEPAFSVDQLEREIAEVAGEMRARNEPIDLDQHVDDYAPPAVRAAVATPLPQLPDYVSHAEAVPEIGKLTAEVIVQDYEATAKRMDGLRDELTRAAAELEAEVKRIQDLTAEIARVADIARDQAKLAFERIQRQAKMTGDIRGQIDAIAEQLRGAN